MKSYQFREIYEYVSTRPITEDNILRYYHHWDMNLDRYDVDMNEFVTLCCMFKCLTQTEDDDVILLISHIYSTTRYQTCIPLLDVLCELAYKKQHYQDKPAEKVIEEMLDLYGEIFGKRFISGVSSLVGDFGNADDYYIDLSAEQ